MDTLSLLSKNTTVDGAVVDALTTTPKLEAGDVIHFRTSVVISTEMKADACSTATVPISVPASGMAEYWMEASFQAAFTPETSIAPAVPSLFVHSVSVARETVAGSTPARDAVPNWMYARLPSPACRKGRAPKFVEGYALLTDASPMSGKDWPYRPAAPSATIAPTPQARRRIE